MAISGKCGRKRLVEEDADIRQGREVYGGVLSTAVIIAAVVATTL
jgi:hypothetical protein